MTHEEESESALKALFTREAPESSFEALFTTEDPETIKDRAEWEAEEAKWKVEKEKLKAEMEELDAKMAEWEDERKKTLNKQEDGLYNDITGKRIPYMNDEGDHIDFDHGWYD